MSEFTYVVVKLKVPEDIQNDSELIDEWLNNLNYDFQDLSANTDLDSDPAYPGRVDSEIVENQFPYGDR